MRLKDKVAIVTGSGSGIGKAIAELFAREGARVMGASRRAVNGQPVIDAIVQQGGDAVFVKCDISIESDVKKLIARTLETYGRIDVLVNNAGVNFLKPFEEVTVEEWDRVINTDLRGTYFCSRYAILEMLRIGGGSVINIASVHTHTCIPGDAPYAAAKWGVIGLTKALAVEFASRNIRVNAISPGAIETQITTDIMAGVRDRKAHLDWLFSNIPMARRGVPEEVASACVFFASDESNYITGVNLYIDGGVTSQLLSNKGDGPETHEGKPRS
jgi:NAD(P)-dependent dehydrogenase (short-subunit alcohol dehydrogenase family)